MKQDNKCNHIYKINTKSRVKKCLKCPYKTKEN